MMKISGQYLWPFSNEGERMLHVRCRAGKGFAVNNLLLVSRKIVSTFADTECNIRQVGLIGFFDAYRENFNIPALPRGVGPRVRHTVDRPLVNTLRVQGLPYPASRPWGTAKVGVLYCHSPLSRRTC